MYLNTSTYGIHNQMPFSVYGENLIILVQSLIIVLLFWAYSKDIGSVEKAFVGSLIGGYGFVLLQDKHVTEEMWALVTSSNFFLSKSYFQL